MTGHLRKTANAPSTTTSTPMAIMSQVMGVPVP